MHCCLQLTSHFKNLDLCLTLNAEAVFSLIRYKYYDGSLLM